MSVERIYAMAGKIKSNINKVIVGKEDVIDLILTSLLCSGHVLLEDVPGLGKTMLAKSLSKSISCSFKRIQFTPDLLPSDLTGINYYNQKTGEFQFREGPLMSQIVLGDEINRATPRTQSSLLEAMEEHQVTVDGKTYILEEPFLVIATQNPIETGGTFPLPEAQLDRFFMQIKMGYPDFNEEYEILKRFKKDNPIDGLESVVSSEEIKTARSYCRDVYISDDIAKYILNIVRETRTNEKIDLGISPRGSLALYKGAQAYAAIQRRNYVTPDDVKHLIKPILSHRIITDNYSYDGNKINEILDTIITKIAVPLEELRKERG